MFTFKCKHCDWQTRHRSADKVDSSWSHLYFNHREIWRTSSQENLDISAAFDIIGTDSKFNKIPTKKLRVRKRK